MSTHVYSHYLEIENLLRAGRGAEALADEMLMGLRKEWDLYSTTIVDGGYPFDQLITVEKVGREIYGLLMDGIGALSVPVYIHLDNALATVQEKQLLLQLIAYIGTLCEARFQYNVARWVVNENGMLRLATPSEQAVSVYAVLLASGVQSALKNPSLYRGANEVVPHLTRLGALIIARHERDILALGENEVRVLFSGIPEADFMMLDTKCEQIKNILFA